MKVSFNTSIDISDEEIVQIIGLMKKNDEKVTQATFKAKVKSKLQSEGRSWLDYNIWEAFGSDLSLDEKIEASFTARKVLGLT
jgi:uncharacterized tellurite resistance protein B-like protein